MLRLPPTNGEEPVLGGAILATRHWVVQHCTGPLGTGTLIVNPLRHCVHLWEFLLLERWTEEEG